MSNLSKTVIAGAKVLNIKNNESKRFKTPKRTGGECTKNKFSILINKKERIIDDRVVLTLDTKKCNGNHIIFLHGGAYTEEALVFHRLFIEKLVLFCNYRVSFIDYPLAPESTALETLNMVIDSYEYLLGEYKDTFHFIGDSAGGGLVLSILMLIREKGLKVPNKNVLISPWLDISLSNCEIKEYEDSDTFLSKTALINIGNKYVGELDTKDYRVSPIYGNLNNLNDLMVFVGTNEIFYPDCIKLNDLVKKADKTSMELEVFDEMFHDFVMAPLKESIKAIDKINKFIRE